MIKSIGGGGLGDAAMLFAKLQNSPVKIEHHTHVETYSELIPVIKEFYDSQKVNCDVKKIKSWKDVDYSGYDYLLETTALGKPWDIKAFPDFITDYNIDNACDIIVSPMAGRKSDRCFGVLELQNFIDMYHEYKIGIVGKDCEFDINNCYNFINKTSLKELIDIIYSCKIFVGHPGFNTYIAAMMEKEVYSTKELKFVEGYSTQRYHPDWNVKFINQLSDINSYI